MLRVCAIVLSVLLPCTYSIPIDNGIVGEPNIFCGPNSIRVTFETEGPWEGKLYAKNHFIEDECKVVGTGSDREGTIELPFDTCSVTRQRSLNPRGVYVHALVVMSFHPTFITKVDRAVRLQCFYMEADKTVSQELEVSMLTTEFATQNVPMPVCRYEILDAPDGNPVRFALVGERVYHKWTCDTETQDTFCMTVYGCFVDDGTQQDTIQLLNDLGCSYDAFLLGNLEYPTDLMAIKEAHVFKYADRANLYFNCQIKIDIKEPNEECVRESCPEPQGLGGGRLGGGGGGGRSSGRGARGRRGRNRFQRSVEPESQKSLGVMDITPEYPVLVGDLNLDDGSFNTNHRHLQHPSRVVAINHPSDGVCFSQTALTSFVTFAGVALSATVAVIVVLYRKKHL